MYFILNKTKDKGQIERPLSLIFLKIDLKLIVAAESFAFVVIDIENGQEFGYGQQILNFLCQFQ